MIFTTYWFLAASTILIFAQRKRLDIAHELMPQTCEKAGVRCLDIGKDFSSEDYLDGIHLTPDGGAKMASTVSQVVKQWKKNNL